MRHCDNCHKQTDEAPHHGTGIILCAQCGAGRRDRVNAPKLGAALMTVRQQVKDGKADASDVAELIRVLARVVEGMDMSTAFGAPGDWGYGTPIGDALAGR